jgi:hypothetical protein
VSDIEQLLKTSSHVSFSPVTGSVHNLKGRYWNHTKDIIFAIAEVRARQGTFTTPWGATTSDLYAPPALIYINDKFDDVVNNRAIELNQKAKDQKKKILIQWSGGIDSTLVLSAFIKNLSPQDLENVYVVMTIDSILENYDFYITQIKDKFRCINWLDIIVTDEFLKHHMLLHGDPADCLLGPSITMYEKLMIDGRHLLPFKDNIDLIAKSIDAKKIGAIKQLAIPGFSRWYTEKITNNLLEVAPEHIRTIADWWWWHYFNFKWQFSLTRPIVRRKVNGAENNSMSAEVLQDYLDTAFFNTAKFQQWSYSNLNTLVGNDISTHKRQAKQYIFELDQNHMYFEYKTKIESMPVYDNTREMRGTLIKPLVWDQNWRGYYEDYPGLLTTYMEKLEKYKG